MEKQCSEKMKNILFVCTGNTCRSPMAEGILKEDIKKDAKLSKIFKVYSAGLRAIAGDPVTNTAVNVLRTEWGIDISGHVANGICANEIKNAFLILTMERTHKNSLVSKFPEMKDKIFILTEYVGEEAGEGISDPYIGTYEVYKRCANEIYINMNKLVKILKKLIE